ncbi:MAG: UDP-N-acetylglucosamine--N-acetylmuramyl-(pentapeptide) pyrophosphoryl-undecaprenol N-acetylglucosamine transferase [Solirubrobacteraceae bacterium]
MSVSVASRIVIAAGGTAGHVVPALAVADELRSRGVEVHFVGGARAEAELVPAAGYPFSQLSVEGLSRSNPLKALRALARAALALPAAGRLLAELAPAAVLGGGGYASGPVGLAALAAGVPLVLSEADSHVGLANRLLAHGARRVCLAFPPRDGVAPARCRVTGRPVPAPKAQRERERERAGIEPQERCVVVFGGSLGARSINLAAIDALAGLRVRHVCGRRDHDELAARGPLPWRYELIDYLDSDGFDRVLATADLIVARSGGSVFEIAAHGLPAVLVPYPHATGGHQRGNARWMADAGAATVIDDAGLTPPRLRAVVAELLADRPRLSRMAAASRALARPHAAAEIADELQAAAGSR